ncbi:hypothetical protein D3C85_1483760 [compost metagenome]
MVQAPHPFRVAAGQVVVHGHHVNALAGDGIQVDGQRRHERLAFARTHFRDLPAVQGDAAQQLRIEVAHAEHPLARFAHNGEGLGQQVVQGCALGVAGTEFLGFGRQLRIGERGDLGF